MFSDQPLESNENVLMAGKRLFLLHSFWKIGELTTSRSSGKMMTALGSHESHTDIVYED